MKNGKTEQVSKNVKRRVGKLPSGRPYHVEKEDMGTAGKMNRSRAGSLIHEGKVTVRSALKNNGRSGKDNRLSRAESTIRVVKTGDGEIMSKRTRQGTRVERETQRTSTSKGAKYKSTSKGPKDKKYAKD